MKKFALALMASAAIVFGFAGSANAYPPGGGGTTVSDSTPAAGAPITFSTTQCTPGETVTFVFNGETKTATCVAGTAARGEASQTATGTASATFNAPAAAGSYTANISGSVSGALGSVAVTVAAQTTTTVAPTPTVPPGGLPATGSDGVGATTGIAVGLLVVGLGLFAVATVRRRQPASI